PLPVRSPGAHILQPRGRAGRNAVVDDDPARRRERRADAADVRRVAAARRRPPSPDGRRRRLRRPGRTRPRGGAARPSRREGHAPMKITKVEATPLAIPLAQEFHWAGGAQVGVNLVLFTVHTDEGVAGDGDSICEDPRAVVAYGELMARQVVGRSPGEMEAILGSIWPERRW